MKTGVSKTTGVEAELAQLERAGAAAPAVAKYALYPGAGTIAEAVKAAAASLPYRSGTAAQIAGAVGITPMRGTADGMETSVGFDGYFSESGFPIPYFVREVERGTSRIPARPFVKPAVRRAQAEAVAAMEAAGQSKLDQIINNTSEE